MTTNTENKFEFPPSLAFLIGAAAGLTAGLFVAGRNGARLRAEIGEAVQDLRQQGSELADQGVAKLQKVKNAATDAAKQKLSGAISDGEREAHHAIDKTVSVVQAAADKSHRTVADTADSLRTGTRG